MKVKTIDEVCNRPQGTFAKFVAKQQYLDRKEQRIIQERIKKHKTMKIQHDNKTYILAPERAIELGVLKLEYVPKSGDFFTRDGDYLMLYVDYDGKCHISGLFNDFEPYSNIYENKENFVEKCLKNSNWVFRKNLNAEITQLFVNAAE